MAKAPPTTVPDLSHSFVSRKTVRAARFRKIYERQRGNIRSFEIIAPRLGSRDFGSFEICFKVPVYDAELWLAR
jgi:hypothetical protein